MFVTLSLTLGQIVFTMRFR